MYTAVCLYSADKTIPGFLTRAGAASYALRTCPGPWYDETEWVVMTDEEYLNTDNADEREG